MSAVDTAAPPPSTDLPPAPPWSPKVKMAVGVGLVVAALLLLFLVSGVLPIVAVAGLVAFLLAPVIRFVHEKLHLPRWLALLLSYLIAIVATTAFMLLVIGSIVNSIREIDPQTLAEQVRTWLLDRVGDTRTITVLGIELDLSEVLAPIEDWLQGEAGTPVDGEEHHGITVPSSIFGSLFGNLLGSVRTVVGIITAVVTSLIVTTLIAMYISVDSERFHDGLMRWVPPGYEGDAARMSLAIKRVWTGYLYGQVINSIITGALIWLVMMAVGLRGAILAGFIMLVLNMIPTIGPILAAIPGILLALIQGSTRFHDMNNLVFGLLVTAIYIFVVQAQANIIAPKVMGNAVKLRPAIIMIGLIAGLQVGGLLGSLLAVPIIATGRDITRYFYYRLIGRDPWMYLDTSADDGPEPDPPEPEEAGAVA